MLARAYPLGLCRNVAVVMSPGDMPAHGPGADVIAASCDSLWRWFGLVQNGRISPARVARCRCGRVFDPGTELLALPLVTDPLPRGGELLRAPISNCGVIANVRAVDALA